MLYYYHWVDTSASGLLFPEDIIRPVVNASALACCITITGSIPLLVDYYSRGHHPSSSQCFGTGMLYYYHWVDTSASGLLVLEDINRLVVNASALACCITITGSIPLLVDS
jgi:hypothetical protein